MICGDGGSWIAARAATFSQAMSVKSVLLEAAWWLSFFDHFIGRRHWISRVRLKITSQ